METRVKLSAILEGLELRGDEGQCYFDTQTGKLVYVTDDELCAAEEGDDEEKDVPDWGEEARQTARAVLNDSENRFLALPSQFDLNEYHVMEEFCRSIEDERISDDLCYQIRGKGAFRRFKEAVQRFGLTDDWYRFRDEAVKQAAIEWCEGNQIAYEDDVRPEPPRESGKAEHYATLLREACALGEGERDLVANAANLAALLFEKLPHVSWAGFYFLKGGHLVLGPFQGKPACARIALGQGVCGTAASQQQTLVVPNVHDFPGHIACDEESLSEICVPLLNEGRLIGVLDLDSPRLRRFDAEDQAGLEALVAAFLSSSDLPS